MSFGYGDSFDLGAIRRETVKTNDTLKELNIKMDRQIALLEKMVEILTKVEERHTDADY